MCTCTLFFPKWSTHRHVTRGILLEKRQSDYAINRTKVRDKLPTRKGIYWGVSIVKGGYLGFRKTQTYQGWLVRYRPSMKKKIQHSIGATTDFDYHDAREAALLWIDEVKVTGSGREDTVETACLAYIKNRIAAKDAKTVYKDKNTIDNHVVHTQFGAIKLRDLRNHHIEEWRNTLVTPKRRKTSVNRILKTLKAALNLAYRQQRITTDQAWKTVEAFPSDGTSREAYLDLDQRRTLVEKLRLRTRNFVLCLMYTGARPQEIKEANIIDVDFRTGTLRLINRKGNGQPKERHVPLTPVAVAHLKSLCQDRIGKVPLCVDEKGRRLHPTRWASDIRNVRASDDVVAYTFRHCFIADCLTNGIDVGTVAKMCGTSIDMISCHYHKFIRTRVEEKLAAITFI